MVVFNPKIYVISTLENCNCASPAVIKSSGRESRESGVDGARAIFG